MRLKYQQSLSKHSTPLGKGKRSRCSLATSRLSRRERERERERESLLFQADIGPPSNIDVRHCHQRPLNSVQLVIVEPSRRYDGAPISDSRRRCQLTFTV